MKGGCAHAWGRSLLWTVITWKLRQLYGNVTLWSVVVYPLMARRTHQWGTTPLILFLSPLCSCVTSNLISCHRILTKYFWNPISFWVDLSARRFSTWRHRNTEGRIRWQVLQSSYHSCLVFGNFRVWIHVRISTEFFFFFNFTNVLCVNYEIVLPLKVYNRLYQNYL